MALDFPNSMMRGIKTDMIENEAQLRGMIDCLVARHTPPLPRSLILYIDLEGVNLSREGTATIITILIDIEVFERRSCLTDLLAHGALWTLNRLDTPHGHVWLRICRGVDYLCDIRHIGGHKQDSNRSHHAFDCSSWLT